MRQTSGAVVCPSCGRLVDVREPKCPFCGAYRPGMFGFATPVARWLGGRLDLTAAIIAITVGLYVLSLVLDLSGIMGHGLLGLLGPGDRALYQLGMTGGAAWRMHWWWTLLTATFLHGGILHLLFNMFAVRNYLPSVVHLYGPARSFSLYMVSGVAGFLLSNVMSGAPTIGASCSIFGLLAALIVYGRRTGQRAVTGQLMQFAAVMFVFGFFMPNVNNWGHAGGFIGGWLAAELLVPAVGKRDGIADLALAGGLALATVAGVVASFAGVTSILLRP